MRANLKWFAIPLFAAAAALFTGCPKSTDPDNPEPVPEPEKEAVLTLTVDEELADAVPFFSTLTATATITDGTGTVAWTSSDTAAFTVAPSSDTMTATVTAAFGGTATLTAKATLSDGKTLEKSQEIEVTIKAAENADADAEARAASVDEDSITDHKADVSWPAEAGATKVVLVAHTGVAGETDVVCVATDEELAASKATVSGLKPSMDYTVTVYAINGTDGTYNTYDAELTTMADATAPAGVDVTAATPGYDSIKLTWTNPADEDLGTITVKYGLYDSESHAWKDASAVVTKVFAADDDPAEISFAANASVSYTFAELKKSKEALEYMFEISTADLTGNNSEDAVVKYNASTLAYNVKPAEITDIVVNIVSKTDYTATWKDSVTDVAEKVTIYNVKDEANPVELDEIVKGVQSWHSTATLEFPVKLLATVTDEFGNESDGVDIVINTIPYTMDALGTGLTGQLVAEFKEDDVDSTATYSYAVTETLKNAGATAVYADGKVYINGLEVGKGYNGHLLNGTAVYKNFTLNFPVAYMNAAAVPTKTVWKLRSWWPTDNPPAIVPHISASTSAGNIVCANYAGASQTSDMMYADATYKSFIVYPALTNAAEGFSLEVADGTGEGTGLVVYADIAKQVSWKDSYSNKTGWGYGNSSKPQVYTVEKSGMTDTQKNESVFTKVRNTTSENAVAHGAPAGYDGWYNFKSAVDGSYWSGSCFNFSMASSPATNGDSDIAILECVLTGEEATDKPTEVDVTYTATDHTITLTWTDPADFDFDHIEISTSDSGVNGAVIADQVIVAGTQTATFTNLCSSMNNGSNTEGVEYTFTFTEYDVFGNTTVKTVKAKTELDVTPPADVATLDAVVGSDSVTLNWTASPSSEVAYYYIFRDSEDAPVAHVPETTFTYKINSLETGTEYTFTVKAEDWNMNQSAGKSVTVTPAVYAAANAKATARFTEEILVTWDRSLDDPGTWQYKVESEGLDSQTFTVDTPYAGTYADTSDFVAQFTGLTVGAETTFTISASEDGENWTTVAVPCTVAAKPVKVVKKIYTPNNTQGSENRYLCSVGDCSRLCIEGSTGFGNTRDTGFTIYPAKDGSITATNTYVVDENPVNEVCDTFSIFFHGGNSSNVADRWVYMASPASDEPENTDILTGAGADAGNVFNMSKDDAITDASKATLFLGHSETSGYNTLHINAADKDYVMGYISGNGDNKQEVTYRNDTNHVACSLPLYQWQFK